MSKFALVTGATGGIGRAIARKLASKGYGLFLHYHTKEDIARTLAKELEERYYIPIHLIQANLMQEEGLKELVLQLIPAPDIVIHNAGKSQFGLFTDITKEEYQEMIQLQMTSPFFITQAILPTMIAKKWGRILFISSIWGETGASCESLYSMTKGAQIALMKSLSKELAPSGISVNAVSPGAIDTEMMSSFSQEELYEIAEDIPMGRMGKPEEIAHVIHFLVEEESKYITGQVIRVNGGWYT